MLPKEKMDEIWTRRPYLGLDKNRITMGFDSVLKKRNSRVQIPNLIQMLKSLIMIDTLKALLGGF